MSLNGVTTRANYTHLAGGRRLALVGTYPPRKCGIATFTSDLRSAIVRSTRWTECGVVALTGSSDHFDYPSEVEMEIRRDRVSDYEAAADYLNESAVNVVCLQHEFGIFGGVAGSYVRFFLDRLNKPVVTTLHTVMQEPRPEYRRALAEVVERSDVVVTMSHMGAGILRDVYGLRANRIVVTDHGTPATALVEPEPFKERLGLSGRFVVITFGLIGPGKGIETVIGALPRVVGRYPEVLYLVVGATHPEVAKIQGDAYLASLREKVEELGIGRHVRFISRFVSPPELRTLVAASDVFVTPYLAREQITSGCLAYALSMGKAVVSTPYWHALELLAHGTGILVGFGSSEEIAYWLSRLMEDRELLRRLRHRAYAVGSRMAWPRVGRRYADTFEAVLYRRAARTLSARPARGSSKVAALPQVRRCGGDLPEVCLGHLRALTDNTGLVQFGAPGRPDSSSGYTVDDAARALVLTARLAGHRARDSRPGRSSAYDEYAAAAAEQHLRFIGRAQTRGGVFLNVMLPDGRFVESGTSQDTQGRVIWGLGEAVASRLPGEMRARAEGLLVEALGQARDLTSPRACAYAICGLSAALGAWTPTALPPRTAVRRVLLGLADYLVGLYRTQSSEDWAWFEDRVTYGNAKLCEALLLSYRVSADASALDAALKSLDFLTRIQYDYEGDYFDLVGNQGWYIRGGNKAVFGQQPVDAAYLVQAYDAAYRTTGSLRYAMLAWRAWEWFAGRNRLGVPLYDEQTGACADGLDPQGVSLNSGAESTVCCLLALLTVSRLRGLVGRTLDAGAQEDSRLQTAMTQGQVVRSLDRS